MEAAMDEQTFVDLVARARGGDHGASSELLKTFERDVRQMVRLKLPRTLRSRFDSMDFVQAVWASFFSDEVPERFDSPRHLRAYLAGVARNKVLEEYRKRTQTRKYDIGREQPLYVLRGGRERPVDVPSAEPTPSQKLQAEDRLAQLVAGRPAVEAQVVRMRQEGLTFEEIAARTGLGERSVRRIFEAMKIRVGEGP
jgi:RNA polymerase sigma-70 factor (ECF subfamily)